MSLRISAKLSSRVGCFFLLGSAALAHADQLSFDTLYRSPHYLGHGDAGVAVADDLEAIFYNPAGIASGKGLYKGTVLLSPTLEASAQAKDLARQVFVEGENNADTLRHYLGKNIHFGLSNASALIFRRAALGVLVNTQTDLMIAKTAEARGVESVSATLAANRVATFSVADSFWNERFQVGSTIKYILRNEAKVEANIIDAANISDQLAADKAGQDRQGIGVDLGLMYKHPSAPWRLGLHMENAGTTYLRATESEAHPRRLPQIVTLGWAYEMAAKMDTLRILADVRDIAGSTEKSAVKRLHLGAEMSVARIIGLNAGLNQGYPTAGIYLNLYVLRCDIGTYTQEIGSAAGLRPDQRYYFRLMAGF